MFEMNSTLIEAQSRNVPLSTYGKYRHVFIANIHPQLCQTLPRHLFPFACGFICAAEGLFLAVHNCCVCVRVWSGPNV